MWSFYTQDRKNVYQTWNRGMLHGSEDVRAILYVVGWACSGMHVFRYVPVTCSFELRSLCQTCASCFTVGSRLLPFSSPVIFDGCTMPQVQMPLPVSCQSGTCGAGRAFRWLDAKPASTVLVAVCDPQFGHLCQQPDGLSCSSRM